MKTVTTTSTGRDERVRRHRRILARDGTSLAVTDWTRPTTARTAVFLHGLCLNQAAWNIQINQVLCQFGGDTRVISYDHRGHGDSASAPMQTYRVDQLADDLDQILTTLRVTGPLTLIGHSLGAMVILTYLSRSERNTLADVRGLVLCATAAGKLPERGVGRLLTMSALGPLASLVDHVPARATGIATAPLCMALDRLRTHSSPQRQALLAVTINALATTPLSTAVGFLPSLRDFNQLHGLGNIKARTTILSGGLDVLTPPDHSKEMATAIPGAVHVHIPSAGHMIPQQAPRIVGDAIARTIAATELHSARCSAPALAAEGVAS